ncbi:sugar transferase [Paracoccaceae bacterium]|nr:sugar transferase [Paracoccaceae bacterium]
MKRLTDIFLSSVMLILALPLMLVAIIGIKISSSGPILYCATRVGMGNKTFMMFKFRSMHETCSDERGAVITAHYDKRIFRFGAILRKTKVDELPQLFNVLFGNMSIVGPRPEDPKIVDLYYSDWMKDTLYVRPGITSPGSIFYYGTSKKLINENDPESSYATLLLPPKIAIECAYLERATWLSDIICIAHTCLAILGAVTNHPVRPLEQDRKAALKWISSSDFLSTDKV